MARCCAFPRRAAAGVMMCTAAAAAAGARAHPLSLVVATGGLAGKEREREKEGGYHYYIME